MQKAEDLIENKSKREPDYHSQIHFNSSGTINIDMQKRPGAKFSAEEMLGMQADVLARSTLLMEQKNYLHLKSPTEIEETYGGYRQHWERLLREGRIRFFETSGGRMTLDLWISEYLQNKGDVDRYCRMKNKVLKQIKESKERHLVITCPNCGHDNLDCIYNYFLEPKSGEVYEANGVCRHPGCGFKFCESVVA